MATSIAAVVVGPSDGARVVQTTAGLAAVQAIGKRHGGRLTERWGEKQITPPASEVNTGRGQLFR